MTIKIIAEIGVNHNGSIARAKEMVGLAKSAGADFVKTQLWNSERVYIGDEIAKMKRLELSREDICELYGHCERIGIELIVTPDEIDDAKFLRDLGMKKIKTSSQDVTNRPMLQEIGKLGMQVIVSTGASTLREADAAMLAVGRSDTILLHCTSCYPAPVDQLNLRVLTSYVQLYDHERTGYSDHTLGNNAAIMALALGARWFEKHFTLNVDDEGPDHAMSMDLVQLSGYIASLHRYELALGSTLKTVMPCEQAARTKFEAFIRHRDSLSDPKAKPQIVEGYEHEQTAPTGWL